MLGGESLLNPELAARLLRQLLADENKERPSPPLESLTPREVEVLQLAAQGQTNRQIAQKLIISAGTVKMHVQNAIARLGVSDRTQAVVRAIELGIIAPRSKS